MLRGDEGGVNGVLNVTKHSAQPSDDFDRGLRVHYEENVDGREATQNKDSAPNQRDPRAEDFLFSFVHAHKTNSTRS